jgi:hypothetical protein
MNEITTEIYILGVKHKIDIEFDYQPEEFDTGISEDITVERATLVGFYTKDGKFKPEHIEIDLQELTPAEYELLDEAVWEYIAQEEGI